MISSNKEAGGLVEAVRSLSKQFSCPENTNGDIKPGLLLVSLHQLSSNAVGPEKLLDDLQSLMMLSADHMPTDKQQQKKKRKGKNAFLDDKPPRVMPMASFSFMYEVDSNEPKLLGLQIVRSPTATVENEDRGVGTLREALISDRRITSKNIVKWAQQLSESLWKIHTSYITVGDFDLDDIFLVSDVHFQRMLEPNSGPSPGKGVEAAGHATEESRRNVWIDLFLLFRRKIATYTSLQRPQSAIQILDDSSSTASVSMPSSISLSSSVRQPSSLSSSSVNIPSSSRRTIQAHNAALLRRLDKKKKAEIPIRRSDSAFEEVRVAYSQWCRHVQRDCRRLGILLLQLIAHRVFATREVRDLKDLVVELSSDESVTKAAGRAAQDDDKSDESSGAEDAAGDEVLFQVARELQRRYPLVGGMPVEIQQLLAVCFAPKEDMAIKGTHANNKNSMAKFTFDFMRKLGEALADLTVLAEENAEIANYVKPVYWTEEDERERLEKKKKARLEMQKKAESATAMAIERVRVERYKLWFSNQPEDYQREFHRKKAATARSNANMKERKFFIHKALFHTWSWDEFAPWLHKTILGYLLRVLSLKITEEERARFGRRNPNPNSVAQKKEKSQKNLKLESVLQSVAKEDACETAKKGTDLYIQMQIDDLVGAISPFVIQKLRDFAIAEAEAAQEVALAALSLKAGINGRNNRQSISHDPLRSSTSLPSLSMERPPSRGLPNPNLPSERPLSRGLSISNLTSERPISRGLSNSDLTPERHFSRGLLTSTLTSERPLSRGFSTSTLTSERPLSRGFSTSNLTSERPLSRGFSTSNSISFVNTQRSKLATARSGQTSRPTTQSKALLEVNEEALRWFVDRLVPILQSYFKQPVQITKWLRQCVSEEVPTTDQLVANAKLLVTSPAQLLHRRIVCRADLLTTKHCKMIRKACAEFCESIKILDRSYAQKFCTIISVAVFYRYHEEQDVRLKGENFAASKLTSFFQSVRIRKIVKHIWHQANEQYLHDSHHHNRSRSRAASEHEHEHERKDNLTSPTAAVKSAAVMEKKDKSGWIAQARPPVDVEWTVLDSDGVVSLTLEFNSLVRENLATWKKVRCFGYESRYLNLTQSSGPTSQIVLSLKKFMNMQCDDFESKPTEFLPLALQSFSVRSPSSGHIVFTVTIACQRLPRQVRFALTVALDPDLTAMLKSKHTVYFKQKCDESITGGRASQGHPPSMAAAAVHKCSVRWTTVKPVRIAGHAKPLGENLLFAVDQFLSLPGVLPVRLPVPHMQLTLSSKEEDEIETAFSPGHGHPLAGPILLLFNLPTGDDKLDSDLTLAEGDHRSTLSASNTKEVKIMAHVPACLWVSARLSWEPSEQDLPQHTAYEVQRRLVLHIVRRDRSGQLTAVQQQQHQHQQQLLWNGEWRSIGRHEHTHLHENLLVCVEHPPPSSSPSRRRKSVDLSEFRHRIMSFLRKYAVEILQHPASSHSRSRQPDLGEGVDDEMLDTGLVVFVQYQVRATNSAGRGPYSPLAVTSTSSLSSPYSNSTSMGKIEQEMNGGRLAQIVVARSQLLASLARATAKDEVRSELIRSIIATAASLSDNQEYQLQLEPKQEAANLPALIEDAICRDGLPNAVVVSPEEEWLARLLDFCPF